MATQLSITNSALIKLGAELITQAQLDAGSNKRAVLAAQQYTIIKEKLLFDHPWNFAIVRVQLTANGVTPAFEFDNEYDLPDDYLRAFYFEDKHLVWKREGEVIVSNGDSGAAEATINMKYIANIDEDLFTVSFSEVLATKLALDLCYAITQSNGREQELKDSYAVQLRDARSFDAQEGTPDQLTNEVFIESRI